MARMTVVTPPTLEPVTLAEARAHCRIDGGTEDGLLSGYLLAARQHVEDITGRLLITQTIDVLYDDKWPLVWDRALTLPTVKILLPTAPVQSITSLGYVDSDGVAQTLSSGNYQFVSGTNPYIVPAYGATWPDVRWQPDAITVRAVVGYGSNPGDVPEPIRHAILLLVGSLFENREMSIGANNTPHPVGVDALLSRYKYELL